MLCIKGNTLTRRFTKMSLIVLLRVSLFFPKEWVQLPKHDVSSDLFHSM